MGAGAAALGADEDLITHCLSSLLRGLILLAGFMLGQYCLGLWNGSRCSSKKAPASPRKVMSSVGHRGGSSTAAGRGLSTGTRNAGKAAGKAACKWPQPVKATSDDEDAASTSAGSTDGASDVFSSDEEELKSTRPGRISKMDLLNFRQAPGTAPAGGLKTAHVDHRTKLAPLPDKRCWDALRGDGVQKGAALPASRTSPVAGVLKVKAPAPNLNPALKPSRKGVPMPKNLAEEAALSPMAPARVEALLQICCPSEPVTLSMALGTKPNPTKDARLDKGTKLAKAVSPEKAARPAAEAEASLPPWRQRSA